MPVNLGLAQVSNDFLVATVVIYSLAVLAYAADFAFGKRAPRPATEAVTPELVGAGARTGAGPLPAGGHDVGAGHTADQGPAGAAAGGAAAAAGPPDAVPAGVAPSRWRAGGLPAGRWVQAGLALTLLGVTAHLTGVITRGLAVHRVPWGDMYEFVTAVTCVAVIFFLGLMFRYRAYYLGLFVMVPVVIALGAAETVIYTPAGPLVPALHSYWLAIHVTAMTLATGTFVIAAVLAVVYLFADRHERRVAAGLPSRAAGLFQALPGARVIDQFAYRTVVFGFPIWTFGIMAGAIWADEAWGRYWGWDPTETWAFITWVVYAGFLHARVTAGWRGRRSAYINLVGFCCLVFNLVGVSLFITGLHSYAGLS